MLMALEKHAINRLYDCPFVDGAAIDPQNVVTETLFSETPPNTSLCQP